MDKLFSILGGVALGAILGILFAPQSGQETRAKIKELAEKKGVKLSADEWEKFVDDVIAKMKQDNGTATV